MTIEFGRRSLLQTATLTAGAALAQSWPVSLAAAQGARQPGASPEPLTYNVKPLPFDPGTIKGLSEKILVSHYQNNYTGAVKRLNAITVQLLPSTMRLRQVL